MARVIMIASGKGGTGKSTVATFLSHELSFKGYKTFLTELDAGFRSIDVISGISENTVYDIGDVLEGSCSAEKAVVVSPHTDKLHIMAAPGRKNGIKLQNLKAFVDSIYDKYDYIVIDTAAGIGDVFTAALAVANMAIVVATPDAVSVRDARIVSDEIYYNGTKDIRLIINKYSRETFRHSGFEDGDSIIDACCAQLLGVVPYDEQMHLSAMTGKPLAGGSITKRVFTSMVERLNGSHVQIIVK